MREEEDTKKDGEGRESSKHILKGLLDGYRVEKDRGIMLVDIMSIHTRSSHMQRSGSMDGLCGRMFEAKELPENAHEEGA